LSPSAPVGCLVYSAFSDSRGKIPNSLCATSRQVWATLSRIFYGNVRADGLRDSRAAVLGRF